MKKIAILTATRAEYGLLSPLIKELRDKEDDDFKVELIVTGTHLNEDYGMTVKEIKDRIDYKIPISVASDCEQNISKNQAEILVKFTELFLKEKYNAVILLGDRYETLAIAIASGNTRTPIFHLYGGDTTEGAMDEWIRHSITKMSYLHFASNEDNRRRIIQLGENPGRVFNYGSTSIDNIMTVADMNKSDVLDSIGIYDCKYALCTYHPVTIEASGVDDNIKNFLEAIKEFPEMEFIITKSNADQGGARINKLLDGAQKAIKNIHVYTSLGIRRYLSLMKYAELVIGNSSSGIIEAPTFHVPTVNIGDRQRGRLQARSIINCGTSKEEIVSTINEALKKEHKKTCKNAVNPYGDGHSAHRIAEKILEIVIDDNIDLKKKFYDITT